MLVKVIKIDDIDKKQGVKVGETYEVMKELDNVYTIDLLHSQCKVGEPFGVRNYPIGKNQVEVVR